MSPHTHPGGQPRSLKQSEARERAALIDVTAYDVTLDLDQGAESFGSVAVIDLVSEGGPTFLDLQPVNVNAVTVNRQPLDIGPLDHGRLPIRTEPGDNHALLATDGLHSMLRREVVDEISDLEHRLAVRTAFGPR